MSLCRILERDGNRGLGLLPLYSLDWILIGYDCSYKVSSKAFACLDQMIRCFHILKLWTCNA